MTWRPSLSRALVEKTTQGWNLLLREDLAILQRRPFTKSGNPNKVTSTDNSPQLTFRVTWSA